MEEFDIEIETTEPVTPEEVSEFEQMLAELEAELEIDEIFGSDVPPWER